VQFLIIVAFVGVLTGAVAKYKGSSFWLWFLIGAVLPFIGLIAAIVYRFESDEPERRCPGCGRVRKVYDQLCLGCGEELDFPADDEAVRLPAAGGAVVSGRELRTVLGGSGTSPDSLD
jgi:hypothetical protein